LNPASVASYPTDTVIVMHTGDENVPEGGQIDLMAQARGRVPQRGALLIRSEGRDWERVDVEAQDDGRFVYTFREIHREFEYRFALGDAQSPTYRVNVVAAPRIVRAQVDTEPPAYMNMPGQRRESLTLTAQEGAVVDWTVHLDTPVRKARLVIEGIEPIEMTTSPDGKTVHARTIAQASSAYRFQWEERAHGFQYEGAKHYLQVTLDHEPRVRIDYPTDNEKSTMAKTLSVTFAARDDYGVKEAVIVHRRNESDPVRTPLGEFMPGESIEQTINKPLVDLVSGLKEGDVVTYHIEVSDAYPGEGGPHRVSSEARRVQILSEEEYLSYMNRRQQSLLGMLRPVYRQQRVASENIRQIQDAATAGGADQHKGDDDE